MRTFTLYRDAPRERVIETVRTYLGTLEDDKAWTVEVKERKATRSQQQNRYLWGVCYPTILREGGETLAGWTSDDLHEYFLGEHFGWEVLEGFGRKRMRPIRRSSKLNKTEFADYVDFIQRTAAGLGIYIPDANEEREAA